MLDGPGLDRLHQVLIKADAAPCRVLLLKGGEECFCDGLDLASLDGLAVEDVRARCRQFTACLGLLRDGAFISIAVVEGTAKGGGVGLAAAADLALALEQASFNLPEVSLGLLPAMVLPTLLARMPRQRARSLCLSGEVDACRALELGLVDQVEKDSAELERAVRRRLRQALRCKPEAVARLKDLDSQLEGLPWTAALERGMDQAAELFASQQVREEVQRFLDGELPDWFERPPRRKKKEEGK